MRSGDFRVIADLMRANAGETESFVKGKLIQVVYLML